MQHGQAPLPITIHVHHRLKSWVRLGKAIAQIEGISLGNVQGRTGPLIVLPVTTRDARVDPVIATTLADEDHPLGRRAALRGHQLAAEQEWVRHSESRCTSSEVHAEKVTSREHGYWNWNS